MSAVEHVSLGTFERDVLDSSVPVLVDFYADWCAPCRRLAPALDRLAGEFDGRVRIVKVNVDREQELAERFQVSSIPTLAFLSGGEVVGQTAGAPSESALRNALNQLVEMSSSPAGSG